MEFRPGRKISIPFDQGRHRSQKVDSVFEQSPDQIVSGPVNQLVSAVTATTTGFGAMAGYVVGLNPDPAVSHIRVSGDTTVSSKHCFISALGDGWFKIVDASSTNGTFVREQGGWRKVTQSKVRIEDEIKLGRPNAKANHFVTVPPCTTGVANRPGANAAAPMKMKKRTPRIASKIRPSRAALKVDASGDKDAMCKTWPTDELL